MDVTTSRTTVGFNDGERRGGREGGEEVGLDESLGFFPVSRQNLEFMGKDEGQGGS